MRSSFILIGMFLFATSVRATPEEDHAEAVRALGVTNIVVKNPGYFFYGGEYVQPPYVVTREGDFLKINGRYIRFFCKWPPPKLRKWHVTYKMPDVPANVTEKTSEFDPVVRKYQDDCFDYWLTTHEADDCSSGSAVVVAGMLKLPCVKDAYIDEDGDPTFVWTDGCCRKGCDYTFMASNPSWWDPPPVDPKAFSVGGDEAAADLAEQISDGRYLFWPEKIGGPRRSGDNLEPAFDKVLKNLDKCATAEELSAACYGSWSVELCAELLLHKESFDASLRKRIDSRMAEIEAAAKAEHGRAACGSTNTTGVSAIRESRSFRMRSGRVRPSPGTSGNSCCARTPSRRSADSSASWKRRTSRSRRTSLRAAGVSAGSSGRRRSNGASPAISPWRKTILSVMRASRCSSPPT